MQELNLQIRNCRILNLESFVHGFCFSRIVQTILVGHIIWIADSLDQAIFNQDSLITIFFNSSHVMGHQNGRLTWLLAIFEVVITLTLKGFVPNSQDLVQNQNITLSLDGHRKGQTHLHTAGVVLELLVHKLSQLSKLHDIIVHGIYFFCWESQHGTIHIDIFAAS